MSENNLTIAKSERSLTNKTEKTVLVTGGTGFLGAYLLRTLLEAGYHNIRAIKRSNSDMDLVAPFEKHIDWINCDLLDQPYLEDACDGVHQIYHCGAMVSFNPDKRDAMLRTNVEGTSNLVNAALHHNVEKLVFASSVAAIGRPKNVKFISENTKWEPSRLNTNYAISKYLSEQEVWRGMAEGLKIAVVNPSVILGSGFWQGHSQFFFRLADKSFPFYPSGSTGLVDVRDVAKFMMLLMESDIEGQRFILSAENWTLKALQTAIANFMGKKPPSIRTNHLINQLAWRIEKLRAFISGSQPILTKETARTAFNTFHYENQKSIQLFDFQYTPIRQTIEETCLQYLNAKPLSQKADLLPSL